MLAFSAIRNSDKVGLILYTDGIERYLPPKKGRRHVLRVVRDILYHEPRGVGTDTVKMLDGENRLLHRRAIVFLISDFETSGDPAAARAQLRRAARQTNRRHDLIAVHIEDPREKELPNVGIIALEDAETGEIIELNTARAIVRKRFNELSLERAQRLRSDLRAEGVDTVQLRTDKPYIPPLQRFFKSRGRPRRMKAIVRIRRVARGCAWSALLSGAALAKAEEDIRDIRGPKAATESWVLPAVLVGAIVIALCAYALRRRRHRGTRPRSLTLSEQALESLESTRPLMRPATAREFGIAASEVIRNYIEKRFDVIATQRTTEEFLQTLLQNSNETLARHRPPARGVPAAVRLCQVAGTALAVADMESLFQSARTFVLETGEAPVA